MGKRGAHMKERIEDRIDKAIIWICDNIMLILFIPMAIFWAWFVFGAK